MGNALIGYSGFVGKNLMNQMNFDYFFNSSNIEDLPNNDYDVLICSAPSAVKWKINQDPIPDLESINSLLGTIKKTKFKKLLVISSVDVYGEMVGQAVDELTIPKVDQHFYGLNRLIFERYVMNLENTFVLRLPGLYGKHLKKNVIFDLCKSKMIENISLNSKLQWFNVDYLSKFIHYMFENEIKLMNISPEPISTEKIVKNFFPQFLKTCAGTNSILYDVRTCYSEKYHFTEKQIMKDIESFIAEIK